MKQVENAKYIKWCPDEKTLTLFTNNSCYQMKIDKYGSLIHTWYGAKHSGRDYSYLLDFANHSFSGNPADAISDRTYSFDTLPQEYPQDGTGDFRITAFNVLWPNGAYGSDLRYFSHLIICGRCQLDNLPSFRDYKDAETLIVTLKDRYSNLFLELYYTVYPDCDLVTRSAKVINKTEQKLNVTNLASGTVDYVRGKYKLLHFAGRHNRERQITETNLDQGIFRISSKRGTSSHQHNPSLIIETPETNENSGEAYALALVYSGGFYIECENDQLGQTRVIAGMDKDILSWQLLPNESLQSPELAMTYSTKGINGVTQNLHKSINEHLLPRNTSLENRPVLINNWEATYFNFTHDKLMDISDVAQELNLDLFVLDDGWFGTRNDDSSGLGDWYPNELKLGCSLSELATEINKKGLNFGIWMEPEMINEESVLYKKHPDWAIAVPGRSPNRSRGQLVLDLSRKDVQNYLIESLDAILSQAPIAYLKWDMNRSICDWYSYSLDADRQGEIAHKYILGVYRIMDWLVRSYPNLLIEGCSGGGGRFDLGMLYYVPQIWTSDDSDAIERLNIQEGTSVIYPISTISAHVSAVPNHQNNRITPLFTRAIVAMQGAFGYELDLTKMTNDEKKEVSKQIAFYKKYESLIRKGKYYRIKSDRNKSWQFVSNDQQKSLLVYVYTSLETSGMTETIRWNDLNPSFVYTITLYTATGETKIGKFNGSDLTIGGLPLKSPSCEYDALCYVAEVDE